MSNARKTIIFPNSKRYKGNIIFKKRMNCNKYFVIKHSIGGHTYRISKEEYEYITDKRKCEIIYAYHHFGVNASCHIKHPLAGKTAMESFLEEEQKQDANNE